MSKIAVIYYSATGTNRVVAEAIGEGAAAAGAGAAEPQPWHGRPFSLPITLPPLATLYFERTAG